MRKFLGLVLAALLALGLGGCAGQRKDTAPAIAPAALSADAQAAIDILDDRLLYLDYSSDETIRSAAVDIWIFEDGGWVNAGGTVGDIEPGSHRMAVFLDADSCDIYTITEEGHVKAGYQCAADFSACTAVASRRLEQAADILPGEEIPLWVKLGTKDSSLRSGFGENFREDACDAGIAVTITFSAAAAG